MIGALPQGFDQRGGAHGCAGECAEHRDQSHIEIIESMRIPRIGSQRAHHFAAFGQRAPQTCMNRFVQWCGMAWQIEKSVEGIREHAVGWKLHRVFRTQDHVQPRMFPTVEATRRRRRNQTVSRNRNQFRSFEPQQTRGIAGNQTAYDVQQSRISILGNERRRQIPSDFEEGLQLCI
jgi:hypothetical protein